MPPPGVPEALSLLWFCKSRQASLSVEQKQLHIHIAAVHAAHLQHVEHVAAEDAGNPVPHLPCYHLDHVGALEPNVTCGCQQVRSTGSRGQGNRE